LEQGLSTNSLIIVTYNRMVNKLTLGMEKIKKYKTELVFLGLCSFVGLVFMISKDTMEALWLLIDVISFVMVALVIWRISSLITGKF